MSNYTDDDIEIIYWGEDEADDIVDSNRFKKKRKRKEKFDLRQELLGFAKMLAIAVVIAFCINNIVIINATVPTGSMEKTIHKKSRMIGNRLAYTFETPKRGDIIIFKYPDDEKQNFVKRVIALPGEKVRVENGVVYVITTKGQEIRLEEEYTYFEGGRIDKAGDFAEVEVPSNCYFVLGDNRNNSMDSRYWKTTNFVREDKIIGKAVFCYYPSFNILN